MKNPLVLIAIGLFWCGCAVADETVRVVCASEVCELYLAEQNGEAVQVPRGEAFVVDYIFDDSFQVRTRKGGTGVFRDKSDLVIDGDFVAGEGEETIADYTRVIQAMKRAFRSLNEKQTPGFMVIADPWEAFSSRDKGEMLKKETVAIDECAGYPITRIFYRHGLATFGGGMEENRYLIRDFGRLGNGVAPGMSQAALIATLGVPMRRSPGMLTYAVANSTELAGLSGEQYEEGVRFYFVDDKLVAVWLYEPMLC